MVFVNTYCLRFIGVLTKIWFLFGIPEAGGIHRAGLAPTSCVGLFLFTRILFRTVS